MYTNMPFRLGNNMLNIYKYKELVLQSFFLDSDGITIRHKLNSKYKTRFKAGDSVKEFKLCQHGYTAVHLPGTRKVTLNKAHLVLLLRGIELPEGHVVDHIDGNPYNNAFSNLRITTQRVNCKNQARKSTNTSGHTGISWNASAKLWTVRQTIKGERIYLGSALTLEEAVQIKENFRETALKDGYTERHLQSLVKRNDYPVREYTQASGSA